LEQSGDLQPDTSVAIPDPVGWRAVAGPERQRCIEVAAAQNQEPLKGPTGGAVWSVEAVAGAVGIGAIDRQLSSQTGAVFMTPLLHVGVTGRRSANGIRPRSPQHRTHPLHEDAVPTPGIEIGLERVTMVERGPDIPYGAKHAVTQPVHALVEWTGPLAVPGPGTQVLQLGHVHPSARLHERLDHSVVAAGCEVRPALTHDGPVTAAFGDRQTAERMGELVAVP
jgi:hypothetical protein